MSEESGRVGGVRKGLEEVRGGLDAGDPKSPHWRAAEPNRIRDGERPPAGKPLRWDGTAWKWGGHGDAEPR